MRCIPVFSSKLLLIGRDKVVHIWTTNKKQSIPKNEATKPAINTNSKITTHTTTKAKSEQGANLVVNLHDRGNYCKEYFFISII